MATIRKKGNKWQAMIRRTGWPHQSANFRTKELAQRWCRDIEGKMDRGLIADQILSRTITLGDLIEIYLTEVTAKRPSAHSAQAEKYRLNRIRRDEKPLCGVTADKLKPEHFEDFRDRRLLEIGPGGQRISPGTVKRELTTLKRVVDHKKRALGLPVNPVNTDDVKRPVVNDERDVRLTPDEKERLLNACYEMKNELIGPFVELGFETGARRGNLLRLLWSDINLRQRTAMLRGLKNSRNPHKIINHQIGLTPRAVEILDRLEIADKRVFPMTANAFALSFNRARQTAKVEHFRFHDTRHERTSSLFEAGWSTIQVMAQTGHRDPKSVMRYANLQATYLAAELAKL
jgi:integrase